MSVYSGIYIYMYIKVISIKQKDMLTLLGPQIGSPVPALMLTQLWYRRTLELKPAHQGSSPEVGKLPNLSHIQLYLTSES